MTHRVLIASLALALSLPPIGCCSGEIGADSGVEIRWRWVTGGECFVPDPEHHAAVDAAARMWAEWGVRLVRAHAEPDLELCLMARHPRPGYAGWTSHPDSGPARVAVNGLIAPAATPALWAHELGHVVLYPGTGHHGGSGILSPHVVLRLDWSPDDVEFLAAQGFEPSE